MIKRIFILPLFFISSSIFAQEVHFAYSSQPEVVSMWGDSVQIKWSTSFPSLAVVNTEREKPDYSWREFISNFDGAYANDHLFTVRGLHPGLSYNLNVCSFHNRDSVWSNTIIIKIPSSSAIETQVPQVVVPANYFTSQPKVIQIWKDSVQVKWSTHEPSLGFIYLKDLNANSKEKKLGYDYNGILTKDHLFVIKYLLPGHIYNLNITTDTRDPQAAWSKTISIATQSSSTGKFTIYFTAPVDTNVSTGVNAIYLNNVVDDTLVNYINRAQQTLDIAIYNTTNSGSVADIALAINNAYARGVRVRIIYDGSTGNTMIPNVNAAIDREASPQGGPYNIMHNKFVVIDANATNANLSYVWTGSTNWTTSQINGTDKNNVIIVQDQSLAQAYKIEFNEMWGDTGLTHNPNTARFGPMKLDNTPHLFNIGGTMVESYFSPSDSVNNHLMNTIRTANTDMEFASMVITRNEIADTIVARVNAGVLETYGLTDDSALTTTWGILKAGMLPHTMASHTGQTGIMHNKYLIVDESNISSDPLVWTGSHNWSASANTQNDENSIVVHDATVANIYYQSFVSLFNSNGGIMSVQQNTVNENDFSFYPNPANENVIVNVKGKGEMNLFSLLGEKVGSWQLAVGRNEINISTLSKGIYILQYVSGNNFTSKKLVIQ